MPADSLPKRTARRQRQITRRKREILDAAARIFAEKGYDAATTREIAEAADLAEGTLYNYYGGKREILLAILDETQAVVDAMFEQAGPLETREDAAALVEQGYALLLDALPFVRTLIAAAWLDDTILQRFLTEGMNHLSVKVRQFIKLRIDAGQFRSVDPALATQMMLAIFMAPMLPVLRGIQAQPSAQECHTLATNVIALFTDGMRMREDEATP
ncbi:MAG: TetR/AcrR family transcriptional regulator [Anaerolineae bacterium]|nr:TetR/AcrR family transcriptional regulator [Anaerolineae bacterium]